MTQNQLILNVKDSRRIRVNHAGNKSYNALRLEQKGIKTAIQGAISNAYFRLKTTQPIVLSTQQDKELKQLFKSLALPCVVRSSALDEDSQEKSSAGIYETTLGITTYNGFKGAIIKTLTSYTHSTARAYRSNNDVNSENLKMGIRIDKLVRARVSGILLTTSPKNKDHILIQSLYGLNIGLTDAEILPDTFEVTKKGRILQQSIVQKDKLFEYYKGAIALRNVSSSLISSPSLTPNQLKELVILANRIEHIFKKPQEVEFSIHHGEIYILQNRPLTAHQVPKDKIEQRIREIKKRITDAARTDPQRKILLSDQNLVENLTERPTRISFSVFKYIFAGSFDLKRPGAIHIGRNKMGYDCSENSYGIYELYGFHPYNVAERDARTYMIKGFKKSEYEKLVKQYYDSCIQDNSLASYPEIHLYELKPSVDYLVKVFGRRRGIIINNHYKQFEQRMKRFSNIFEKRYFTERRPKHLKVSEQLHNQSSHTDLTKALESFVATCEYLRSEICVDFVMTARLGFYYFAKVFQFLQKTVDHDFLPDNYESTALLLTAAPAGNTTTRLSFALADLFNKKISLNAFLSNYGHWGINELELSNPRFVDDLDLLNRIARSTDMKMGLRYRKQNAKKKILLKDIITYLGQRNVPTKEFLHDINMATRYLSMREDVKSDYLIFYKTLRDMLIRISHLSLIDDDIFYLDFDELTLLNSNKTALKRIIRRRKHKWEMNRYIYLPGVITSENTNVINKPDDNPNETLLGEGMGGVVSGIVQIIENPGSPNFQLDPRANILVAGSTDRSWVTVLSQVAKDHKNFAIIIEKGGILSHLAILSAEMGFTVITGIPHIRTHITNGMRLVLNGNKGSVKITSSDSHTHLR